jgi:2-polyprenyl-3-methyl-5-hydroxy-6-metoxy-1,4-benzoquinol methylase
MPKHPEAELFRCSRCTHAFSRPDSIAEPETYQDSYFEEQHKRWFEHPNVELFRRIADYVPKGASVLDVGCGKGDFLRFIWKIRPDLRLSGIDLSGIAQGDGIRFIRGDILSTEINEQFDVVVSLAVIEHIRDVKGFVQRLRRLAKPRGIVVAMTLNDSSLLYALARAGRRVEVPLAFDRLYSKHHLHHFTRKSLRTVFTDADFAVISDFDHDAPIEAMDIPVKSSAADAVLRSGLRLVWKAAKVTQRGYLQTIVCTSSA